MRRVFLPHEPEHTPDGDPCSRCGLRASRHRVRDRRRSRRERSKRDRRARLDRPIVAIDGEGHDLPCRRCGEYGDRRAPCPVQPASKTEPTERMTVQVESGQCLFSCGHSRESRPGDMVGVMRPCLACPRGQTSERPCDRPHVYTYLSAVDEHGKKRGCVKNPDGLSTLEVLRFLTSLGEPRLFIYSFGYEITMWMRDLSDESLYRLMRPEKRNARRKNGKAYRKKERYTGFSLDYLRRRLDVAEGAWDNKTKRYRADKRVTVWDVIGFFQSTFVSAIKKWKTTSKAEIARIAEMKDRRSEFAEEDEAEIEDYCDRECHYLARLMRQVIEAHETADLSLSSFYGAGSSASALLTRIDIKAHMPPSGSVPDDMRTPIAQAFFGGRFETSIVGPVEEACASRDLRSAYPYQISLLPCLAHGKWTRVVGPTTDREVRAADLALVRCRVKQSGPRSWGPLPWRFPSGNIVFPLRCDETWTWRAEYLAAKDTLWPGVCAEEAWTFHAECECEPFREFPDLYRKRLAIGADDAGIVFKLAMNSGYGKLAQSVGSAPFQCWVWAGCITSGTRADILRAIACARDPSDVLMVATDGIIIRGDAQLPAPRDTGTFDLDKPLGSWEYKEPMSSGVFIARPGIYWPRESAELAEVKGRGVSRTLLGSKTRQIEEHFRRHGWTEPFIIEGGVKFIGAMQALHESAAGVRRAHEYGSWLAHQCVVTFGPAPKRCNVRRDGTLECWERMPGASSPYSGKRRGSEGEAMRRQTEVQFDQGDADMIVVGDRLPAQVIAGGRLVL